jgi:ribulose-5-phosphate 4-epimerase/fuculose-1-phosphate aldolase
VKRHLVSSELLSGFAAAARRAVSLGLMRCSSGNMSFRLDEQHLVVKVSRAWMGELAEDDITLCRIADGISLDGRTPSVEIGFHAGILRARPEVNVVLHFQTPFATTLACSEKHNVNFFVIPEIPYYIGAIGQVPYIMPGTPELAAAVVEVMKTHNLAMLANHGQVTVGATFDEAIQRAVFFELASEIIVRAGDEIRPLTPAAAAALCQPAPVPIVPSPRS